MAAGVKKQGKNNPEYFRRIIDSNAWLLGVIGAYVAFKLAIYASGRVFFDEGVYVAMGRYFAFGGQAGYFEYIRPLLLPATLAPLQYLPVDPLLSGRLLGLALTIGSIMIVYYVARKHLGENSARWSVLLFAMSGSVLFFGGTILTDVAVFALVLLSASLAWQDKTFFSGCALGAAFLLKFPVLLLAVPVVIMLICRYRQNSIVPILKFGFGMIILAMPYFIFNLAHYSGPLMERITIPLIDASRILQNETWVYEKASILKYVLFLLLVEFPLSLSFFLSWRKVNPKCQKLFTFFTICALVFLAYFSFSVVRLDYRYMLSVIPFMAAIGGFGIAQLKYDKWKIILSIMAIPFIISIALISMGIADTTANIPHTDGEVFTNAGQALLKVSGKSELYPGPNMGYMYQQWRMNLSAEILVIDLEGYPCKRGDLFCMEDMHMRIGRLITANNLISCGQLYGEDVIVISKQPISAISIEECSRSLRSGPYQKTESHSFVRVNAIAITQEGSLQNIWGLHEVISEITQQNISAVLVLVPSNATLDNESRNFIRSLPSNIELGVLPSEGVDTGKFIGIIAESTGKKITVVASPSDDWIGRSQDFPLGVTSCVNGAWDQTAMSIPCRKMDLYTVKNWSTGELYDGRYLQSSYDALSDADYEVGLDIPAQALNKENLQTLVMLVRHMSERNKEVTLS